MEPTISLQVKDAPTLQNMGSDRGTPAIDRDKMRAKLALPLDIPTFGANEIHTTHDGEQVSTLRLPESVASPRTTRALHMFDLDVPTDEDDGIYQSQREEAVNSSSSPVSGASLAFRPNGHTSGSPDEISPAATVRIASPTPSPPRYRLEEYDNNQDIEERMTRMFTREDESHLELASFALQHRSTKEQEQQQQIFQNQDKETRRDFPARRERDKGDALECPRCGEDFKGRLIAFRTHATTCFRKDVDRKQSAESDRLRMDRSPEEFLKLQEHSAVQADFEKWMKRKKRAKGEVRRRKEELNALSKGSEEYNHKKKSVQAIYEKYTQASEKVKELESRLRDLIGICDQNTTIQNKTEDSQHDNEAANTSTKKKSLTKSSKEIEVKNKPQSQAGLERASRGSQGNIPPTSGMMETGIDDPEAQADESAVPDEYAGLEGYMKSDKESFHEVSASTLVEMITTEDAKGISEFLAAYPSSSNMELTISVQYCEALNKFVVHNPHNEQYEERWQQIQLFPIHLAALVGHTGIITSFLEYGADPCCEDSLGRTALFIAAQQGNVRACALLVDLAEETIEQREGEFAFLYHSWADEENQGYGWIDSEHARRESANTLAISNKMSSPMHVAAERGHDEIVKLLLQSAADPNIVNRNGQTPLHVCSTTNSAAILIEAGADYTMQDSLGRSPLFLACVRDHFEVATFLCDCDVNDIVLLLPDLAGDTPLHAAACLGNMRSIECLLQRGIKADKRNNRNLRPSDLALFNGHIDCQELLLEYEGYFEHLKESDHTVTALAQPMADAWQVQQQTNEDSSIGHYSEESRNSPEWMQLSDEQSGCVYFWNRVTGESKWTLD